MWRARSQLSLPLALHLDHGENFLAHLGQGFAERVVSGERLECGGDAITVNLRLCLELRDVGLGRLSTIYNTDQVVRFYLANRTQSLYLGLKFCDASFGDEGAIPVLRRAFAVLI